MAKELPYFKFESAEWLAGRIVLEPLEIQGAYINIVALYWQRLGDLTEDDVRKRFGTKVLNQLIEKEFIESGKDGELQIQFLNEQLEERQQVSEKRSKAGTKGGKASAKQKQASAKQKQAEEKRIEESKEENVKLDFVKLLSFINQKTGRKFKTINNKVKLKYKARLKDGYTKEDILNSIVNASNLQYHKDNGCQYLTPEFFSRQDTLDKYGNEAKGNLIASFPDPVN